MSPEDTRMVAALIYQYYATTPLIDVRERDGLIDVTAPSDVEWNVVETHELVP